VFEDPETAYATAMHAFVQRSAPRTPPRRRARPGRQPPPETEEQAARRTRREQQRSQAAQWAQVLQQRQQEDAAWEAAGQERRACLRPARWTSRTWATYLAAEDRWLLLRDQRQATLAQRQREEAQWLADQEQQQAAAAPATKPPWVAVLVLTDNCTRQCLGLPLFAAGNTLTAEAVIAALRVLLPDELQFLISDRGIHFTAQQFAALAQEEDFVHVLIARHRPQSNGIAERFVRTLKEWLAERAWGGTTALALLLEQFRAAYNDRPHQGLALPGLSPNEFAARLWLL
jgi:transposase InsO family protein